MFYRVLQPEALGGFELTYGLQTELAAEIAAQFRARAEAKRKYWTSSSDDHQNAKYVRPPCGTPVTTLERILRQTMPMSVILAA